MDLSGRRFLWKLFNRFPNEFEITANMAFQLIREMAGNLGSSFSSSYAFVRSRRRSCSVRSSRAIFSNACESSSIFLLHSFTTESGIFSNWS